MKKAVLYWNRMKKCYVTSVYESLRFDIMNPIKIKAKQAVFSFLKHLENVFSSVESVDVIVHHQPSRSAGDTSGLQMHQFNTWTLFIEDSCCFIHAQTLVLSSWSNRHSLGKTSPVSQHVLFPTLQTAQRKRLRKYAGYPWCNIHRSRVLNDYSKLETKLVD